MKQSKLCVAVYNSKENGKRDERKEQKRETLMTLKYQVNPLFRNEPERSELDESNIFYIIIKHGV